MSAREDARLDEARRIPIVEIAHRLGVDGLRPAGVEKVGPCPKCGGRDRFGINPPRNVYNCRSCGGGDGLALVQLVLGCDFAAALSWLVGAADVRIDPEEEARRQRLRDEEKHRRAAFAARERERAVAAARSIWSEGVPASGSPVAEYLERRGLPEAWSGRLPSCLRFHAFLPYMVPAAGGGWVEVHCGPAMLAAVQDPQGEITGVHRTWLDLSRRKGKAVISHDGRDDWPAKKILGHKKGCAIRLTRRHEKDARLGRVMVMGEGIETTLTALACAALPEADYWCGIDLGNMAGRRITRGAGMKYAGVPDLEDAEAFLPPPWVRHLIFIQDGDSEPRLTRAKLLAGLRRARAKVGSVERVQIVHAGTGRDLNDVIMEDEG